MQFNIIFLNYTQLQCLFFFTVGGAVLILQEKGSLLREIIPYGLSGKVGRWEGRYLFEAKFPQN